MKNMLYLFLRGKKNVTVWIYNFGRDFGKKNSIYIFFHSGKQKGWGKVKNDFLCTVDYTEDE